MVARPAIVTKKVKERDSNMELLRIISMLLILCHHFIIHVFYPNLITHDGELTGYRIASCLITGFTFVGVNCFVLISGFYGIRFRIKSLFNLYCICVFYTVFAVIMNGVFDNTSFNRGLLYHILLPFSHTEWWFIKCYVALFFISPVLNAATDNLGKKEFAYSLLLLTVLNIYFGFYWHEHNNNGYNLVQFVYVYLIGAYLKRYPLRWFTKNRSIITYISCALIWSLVTIISIKWRVPHWGALHYNNPFVLLASIGLFIFMSHVDLYSKGINWIASSVLAAYLIQDVEGGWVYRCADAFNTSIVCSVDNIALKTSSMITFILIGSIVVLWGSIMIDQLRLLLMKPIWQLYSKVSRSLNGIVNDKSLTVK